MPGLARSTGLGPERVRSLADGVARVVFEYLGGPTGKELKRAHALEAGPAALSLSAPVPVLAAGSNRDLCASCGNATLALEEGCKKCHSCGYSEC